MWQRKILALLLSGLLVACGGAEVRKTVTNVSLGQQLIDLKQARDTGALSAADYERQRHDLIDSVR
jgi:hypothetical protein